jgi:hypothetical protein
VTKRKSLWDSAVAITEDPYGCLLVILACLGYLALTEVHWLPWVFALATIFLVRRDVVDNRAAKANR